MSDTISSLAQKLRPYWLRDATGGGVVVSGGGAMSAHALNGPYHTGTLDEAQAPWAVTDSEFAAHTGDPDAHHARQHLLANASGLGPDHTVSGAVAGYVLKATAANAARFMQLAHSDLGGVTADQHHAQVHNIVGSDHTLAGSAFQLVGATGTNTLGLLTPSSNPGAAAAILRTSSGGGLTLDTLTVTSNLFISGVADFGTNTLYEDATYLRVEGAKPFRFAQDVVSPNWSITTAGLLTAATATLATSVQTPLVTTISGDLTLSAADDILLNPTDKTVLPDGKIIQTDSFASGFAGNGMRLDQGVMDAGHTSFEVDNLTVRGILRVYELLIHQIRATNGSIFVSSTAKVAGVTSLGGGFYQLVTDGETAHGFLLNDIIRAQRFTGSGVYQSNGKVTNVIDLYKFNMVLVSGTVPAVGMEFVRLGNEDNTNRQGTIYLTADDSGAPFVDVVDGIASHADWNTAGKVKVRLGQLNGIFGAGKEYGLYAGQGTADTDKYLRLSGANAILNNIPLKMFRSGTQTVDISTTGDIWIGPSNANKKLIFDSATGDLTITGTVTATAGAIAQWSIASNVLSSTNMRLVSGAGARLEIGDYAGSSDNVAGLSTGSASGNVILWAGKPWSTRGAAPFVVTLDGALYAASANITGTVTASAGAIGGWTIGSNLISSTNARLVSGAGARLEVGTFTDANTAGVSTGSAAGNTVIWAGQTFSSRTSAPFRVTLAGTLYATDANIEGDIVADTGYIGGTGGWVIDTNNISSTSSGIKLTAGALGTARLEVGSAAGIASVTGSGQTVFWAGAAYGSRDSAVFKVDSSGLVTASNVILSGSLNISGTGATISGNLYAGSSAVRLAPDGQRMVLPNTTGISVPTSSSAIRWFPSIDGTHDYTKNYTGLVGYRHTGYNVVDMLYTSFVGSTDAATYAARMILQAGHQTGSDPATTYTDCRLEVIREAGAGQRVINAYCNTLWVEGGLSAQAITDRTPHFEGDALAALRGVKGKRGEIDHGSLPAFARRQLKKTDGSTEEGRDLGAMISILVAAVGQLQTRLEALERKV